jgi:CheY-like chemotaxis protein
MGALCSSATSLPVEAATQPLSQSVADSNANPPLEQHAVEADEAAPSQQRVDALPARFASFATQAAAHSAQARALLVAINDGVMRLEDAAGVADSACALAELASAGAAIAAAAAAAAGADAGDGGAAPLLLPSTALLPSPPLCLDDDAGAASADADEGAANASADADAVATGAGVSELWQDNPLGMHVLLVDDQAVIRRVGEAFLQQLGCTVSLLSDGDEVEAALMQPRDTPIDAIILDIVMKRSDGGEVCRALRERLGCMLPIVAITRYSSLRAAADFFSCGFDTLVQKPFTRDTLARALLEARARRSAHQRTQRLRTPGSIDGGVESGVAALA